MDLRYYAISSEIIQVGAPALKGWWQQEAEQGGRCAESGVLKVSEKLQRWEHKPPMPVGPSTRLCWLSDQDRQQHDPAQGDNPHLSQFHKRNQTGPTGTRSVPMLRISENLADLLLVLYCGVAGHYFNTQDATVGNRALSDHHNGISDGKYFFPNVLSFQLGTSADHKGVGSLQTNQFFKNKLLLLRGKATDDKKAERKQGTDQHVLQMAVTSSSGAQ